MNLTCPPFADTPVTVAYELTKVHTMIDDLDAALAPLAPFSENHDTMRAAAYKLRLELIHKVRAGLARHPGVNHPPF